MAVPAFDRPADAAGLVPPQATGGSEEPTEDRPAFASLIVASMVPLTKPFPASNTFSQKFRLSTNGPFAATFRPEPESEILGLKELAPPGVVPGICGVSLVPPPALITAPPPVIGWACPPLPMPVPGAPATSPVKASFQLPTDGTADILVPFTPEPKPCSLNEPALGVPPRPRLSLLNARRERRSPRVPETDADCGNAARRAVSTCGSEARCWKAACVPALPWNSDARPWNSGRLPRRATNSLAGRSPASGVFVNSSSACISAGFFL